MSTFIIVASALLGYPILALASIRNTRNHPSARKLVLYLPLALSMVVILCVSTDISTVSENINFLLCTIIYLSVAQWLILLSTFRYLAVKVTSWLTMSVVFGLGYLMSTFGILGLGFIVEALTADRTISLPNHIIYRQYNLGDAISDYTGINIEVYRTWQWLPGLEQKIFTKQYEERFKNEQELPVTKNQSVLYSHDFPVKYNSSARQLILLDKVKTDTIRLP